MGLFTPKKERKTQLYFRDDNRFQFIPRELECSCLVEKEDGIIKKAWKHFYATELPFHGYMKITPTMVTIGFGRDIILDPFKRVPEGDLASNKPKPTLDKIKSWIAKIAESQRQIRRTKRSTTFLTNKIIWAEIGLIFLFGVGWIMRYLL